MEHPIERAARVLGSQVALASLLGVTKAAVGQWKEQGRRVPAEHCPVIERATRERGCVVTCEELRPDMAWEVLREQVVAGPVDRGDASDAQRTEVDADGTPFVRTDFRTHADGRQSEQHETHAVEPKAAA